MKKIYLVSIILGICALSLAAQENKNLLQRSPETFWGTDIPLIPFRLPLPDKGSISYIDLDKDGDPDVLRATIHGKINIQWIDDDDDMKEGDIEGDTDSDCLMIDRNGDGSYGGDYDLMIDWNDEDGNGKADLQVIADNSTFNERRGKYMSHYMIFIDTDNDGVFNYIDWNKQAIEAWDHEGRCNFYPDYNGQSIFLKAHAKTSEIEDLRYNWENPFLFYDFDNDGLTEMTIRLVDETIPKNKRPQTDDTKKVYPVSYSKNVVGVYMGIDLDNDSEPGNELDFDMSLMLSGEGFNYSKHVHKYKSMRGLPESDKFFEDPRWRQLTELIYVGHDAAYNEIFDNGNWNKCWFVFDEDDDCHRWERVEFYQPLNPFKIGARNGGLDNGTQADVSGDRGEWDLDFSGKGQLYIAPFDGKIHLLGAETGYWRIDQFATYYQGWQGSRTPSIQPEDFVTTEPDVFATIKYTDTDSNGFFDQVDYDLDGDTLFEETVRLKDFGINDVVEVIQTAGLDYKDYQDIYSKIANNTWNNALKAVQVAQKYGLGTNWYSFLMQPKSLRKKYSYGYWLSFYIHRDLLCMFKRNGNSVMVKQVQKAYYSTDWNILLK